MVRYVEGVNPTTGEILKVEVTGNFPFKDPVTNEFIIDKNGQVVTPGRERERFARLDSQRREVPDPRPMASAVAFAFDVTPEEEVRRLIASADRRVLENYAKADASGMDFFDDDFETDDNNGIDDARSPFEFVRDLVSGVDVPRPLVGAFESDGTIKGSNKPVKKGKAPSAIPTGLEGASPSPVPSNDASDDLPE